MSESLLGPFIISIYLDLPIYLSVYLEVEKETEVDLETERGRGLSYATSPATYPSPLSFLLLNTAM